MWPKRLVPLLVVPVVVLSACQLRGPGAGAEGGPTDEATAAQIPEEELRAAARDIEREVHAANRDAALEDREGVVVDTPEIRQAVRTRAARIDILNRFLLAGWGWERRNGRVWILRSKEYKDATTSRQRDLDAIMINSENNDRWTLYEGLIDANGWPQRSLDLIERVFFEERLAYMPPGEKYEDENGEVALTQ